MPSVLFVKTAFLPFGSITSVLPRTLTGRIFQIHLATKKLLTAQIQTAIPNDTVTKRVGMRRSSAIPIQNREKRTATTRDTTTIPAAKETKRRRGVKDKANWIARNACMILISQVRIFFNGLYSRKSVGMWKTNREDRLLIRKGTDICVDLLAGIGLHHRIEQRLHAGDNSGGHTSDRHHVYSTGRRLNLMNIKINKKREISLCGRHCCLFEFPRAVRSAWESLSMRNYVNHVTHPAFSSQGNCHLKIRGIREHLGQGRIGTYTHGIRRSITNNAYVAYGYTYIEAEVDIIFTMCAPQADMDH